MVHPGEDPVLVVNSNLLQMLSAFLVFPQPVVCRFGELVERDRFIAHRFSESDSDLSRNLGMIHLDRAEQLVGHPFMGPRILEDRSDDASLIGDGNRSVPPSPKWKANDSRLDHRRVV